MSESNGRRKWSAGEKLRIVLAGLDRGTNLSELCRREGISQTQYYAWKQKLQGSAKAVFEHTPAARPDVTAAELQRLRNVIAEITAENLELKKGRWV
jgi:transposase